MPNARTGKRTESKGMCTAKRNGDSETTTTETEPPCNLKQEVQTIIDIMGPSLSPHFNTSSEADNEDSTFSKISSEKSKKFACYCVDESEKTDKSEEINNNNISTAADLNTTTSATLEDLTDPKMPFPYVETVCSGPQYICPPPLVPANICVNSECFCPQVASLLHGRGFAPYEKYPDVEICDKPSKSNKNIVINWLKTMLSATSKPCEEETGKYYKMNVKKKRGNDNSPPRRVVFELVEDAPKNDDDFDETKVSKKEKNFKNERLQTRADVCCRDPTASSTRSKKPIEKTTYSDHEGKTRVDVYYFDHGSFNHYQTTDAPPLVTTEEMADKTEKHTTRFWAELFGTMHIGFSFATSFILQFFKFVLYSLFRPLTIGLIQLGSDYFFKPLLATCFNGIIQPILIFLYNIVSSIRDVLDPLSEGIGFFFRELAVLVRAFRIVDVQTELAGQGECKCEKQSRKHKTVC